VARCRRGCVGVGLGKRKRSTATDRSRRKGLNESTVRRIASLFSAFCAEIVTGRSGMRTIKTGGWRKDTDGPMQVVSGRRALLSRASQRFAP
jgi:hypothetical protein